MKTAGSAKSAFKKLAPPSIISMDWSDKTRIWNPADPWNWPNDFQSVQLLDQSSRRRSYEVSLRAFVHKDAEERSFTLCQIAWTFLDTRQPTEPSGQTVLR